MKVLQKGNGQKGWSIKMSCTGRGNGNGGCGAKLLVEQDDVFGTSSSSMGRDIDYYATFRCPECGCWSDLAEWPPFAPRESDQYRDGKVSGGPLPK